MDMGPIPWTAVVQYIDRHQFDAYEQEALEYCISVFDKILSEQKK